MVVNCGKLFSENDTSLPQNEKKSFRSGYSLNHQLTPPHPSPTPPLPWVFHVARVLHQCTIIL